ncbi:hypothetical protein [uncultured Hyphomicrobium sp.]|uniref:hypothetical protein n=1 Tax=uncultured Hyphomicrobium sp. TaxID=194373 RepID=UPI0025F4B7E7|nr:hypothetical protein [uncultured Hyphomicrobium sp.]
MTPLSTYPAPAAVSNIKPSHAFALDVVRHPDSNLAIYSCFADGKPAVALVNVSHDGRDTILTPLFLGIDAGTVLIDHAGRVAHDRMWRQQPGQEG